MNYNFIIYFVSLFFISNASMASDLTREEVKTALKHPSNSSLLKALPELDLDVESQFPAIAAMLSPESLMKKSSAVNSATSTSASSAKPGKPMLAVRDPDESDVIAPVFPGFHARIKAAETAKDKRNFKDSDTTGELMKKLLERRMASDKF